MAYNKYRAKKVNHPIHGKFDSQAEYNRYEFLLLMQKAGEITGEIQRQVPYNLIVNGIKVCTYKADFVYKDRYAEVIEDVKGFITPEFRLKAKLFHACFAKQIHVVHKPDTWQ